MAEKINDIYSQRNLSAKLNSEATRLNSAPQQDFPQCARFAQVPGLLTQVTTIGNLVVVFLHERILHQY